MDEQADDYGALKRRLLGRIVFAVVVLAGLLASLVVFDRMNAPTPAPEKRSAPAEAKAPAPSVERKDAAPQATDVAKSDALPVDAVSKGGEQVAETSALPKGEAQAAAAEKPLTRPATGRHALMRAAEPVPPPRPDLPRASPAPDRPVASPAVTRPLAMANEKPFALQLGVFGDVANAEELRARLERAGIHATIEARVHVGPFASRAEADAARAKLRELGISEAVLFSMKGRRAP